MNEPKQHNNDIEIHLKSWQDTAQFTKGKTDMENYIDNWKLLFNALSGIQKNMKDTYDRLEGKITRKDYEEAVNYISMTMPMMLDVNGVADMG